MRPRAETIVAARALLDDPVVGPILEKHLGSDWKAINIVRSAALKMLNAVDQNKKTRQTGRVKKKQAWEITRDFSS